MLRKFAPVRILALLFIFAGLIQVSAQEETQEPPPPTPTPDITSFEPGRITVGQEAQLSILGSGFVQGLTTVRLDGYGFLTVTFINSGALTAEVPDNVARNDYFVVVSNGSTPDLEDRSDTQLRVVNPPATAAPPQPTEPPPPTAEPPTAIPGEPSLVVRNYTVNPAAVPPGGTTTFTLEVVNQGNRAAQGVSVSVDTGGTFVPASGQAAATLPDIPPGGSFTTTLNAVAAANATPGPTSVGLTFVFRDFEGGAYTSKATITATVEERALSSQVTLARYLTNPNPVIPGQPVTITALVTNSGTETARQVLFRVTTGAEAVLLAGPQGDSFPIGDLAPGASASIDLPLIVSSEAKFGPQPQGVTITFLQQGEAKEIAGSMTLEVARIRQPAPLLLLESYDIGTDVLQPGDQFNLTMNLQNVGDADASEVTVIFGTVESTGDDDDSGTPTGGSTNTTPSTTFAPLGAGGTMFIGDIAADREIITITQDFIVNGGVNSGIYSLPITLRYRKPDGTTGQDNLRASVVVVVPPRLRINALASLIETVNVGEPVPFSLEVINTGTKDVNFTFVNVEADNAEILEGDEIFLGPLRVDEDTTVDALFSPLEEGALTITVTFYYLDDLNQEKTLIETYTMDAVLPPPPPEEEFPIELPPIPTAEPAREDLLGRLLLGLLGLGS